MRFIFVLSLLLSFDAYTADNVAVGIFETVLMDNDKAVFAYKPIAALEEVIENTSREFSYHDDLKTLSDTHHTWALRKGFEKTTDLFETDSSQSEVDDTSSDEEGDSTENNRNRYIGSIQKIGETKIIFKHNDSDILLTEKLCDKSICYLDQSQNLVAKYTPSEESKQTRELVLFEKTIPVHFWASVFASHHFPDQLLPLKTPEAINSDRKRRTGILIGSGLLGAGLGAAIGIKILKDRDRERGLNNLHAFLNAADQHLDAQVNALNAGQEQLRALEPAMDAFFVRGREQEADLADPAPQQEGVPNPLAPAPEQEEAADQAPDPVQGFDHEQEGVPFRGASYRLEDRGAIPTFPMEDLKDKLSEKLVSAYATAEQYRPFGDQNQPVSIDWDHTEILRSANSVIFKFSGNVRMESRWVHARQVSVEITILRGEQEGHFYASGVFRIGPASEFHLGEFLYESADVDHDMEQLGSDLEEVIQRLYRPV